MRLQINDQCPQTKLRQNTPVSVPNTKRSRPTLGSVRQIAAKGESDVLSLDTSNQHHNDNSTHDPSTLIVDIDCVKVVNGWKNNILHWSVSDPYQQRLVQQFSNKGKGIQAFFQPRECFSNAPHFEIQDDDQHEVPCDCALCIHHGIPCRDPHTQVPGVPPALLSTYIMDEKSLSRHVMNLEFDSLIVKKSLKNCRIGTLHLFHPKVLLVVPTQTITIRDLSSSITTEKTINTEMAFKQTNRH